MSAGCAVIIGAGVIGAWSAYFLERAGWKVTVLDQGGFGKGCSHGNCGYVSPSHVLPIPGPKAVGTAIRALLQRNGPFKIRFRFDPALWRWMALFLRRCNYRDMLRAGHALHPLLQSSRSLYEQVIGKEKLDCEWQARGLILVFRTKAGMEEYAETNHLLAEEYGVPAKRLDGDELSAFEPALKPGLGGGWFYDIDAHLRPDRFMAEMRRLLAERGVTILEGQTFREFRRKGPQAEAVVTERGELTGDVFVVATGAWTPRFSKQLGCTIPIEPGKGYSITMGKPAHCPRVPLIFEEHRVAVTPLDSGYRLGSTMEFAGYDSTLRRDRLELLKAGAAIYLHEPVGEPVLEEWFGWRPMTPDGVPIIGRSPAMGNVFIAAGHNMIGLATGSGTGRLVAELVSGQPPHLDPHPYRPERFT
ncbi:MAG: FAD-dependent oxidoreductase [Gemmatales bacterium]|nr:FAD-dependent oxidoreductase [Gemmatales bacterium]MDW8385379.1 FAD-dependent oxidoreductase [Gemmatales bacterium]